MSLLSRRSLLQTAAALFLASSAFSQATDVMRERVTSVMGTSLELRVIGEDPQLLEEVLDEALKEIQRVEDVMTDWRPSPLENLNNAAGKGPQVVSIEVFDLIERSLKISELTGGAFDVTYAGAGRLWDFKSDPPRIPSEQAIADALKNVGWCRLALDAEKHTIDLPANMRIGLGGIAKGYGVDRAMKVLLDRGIKHGMVNAGGDLKALGTKFGKPWEIAIRHPRDRNRVLALLPVSNTCVVTSGDYERFIEVDGKRYHHIIDPRTGSSSTGCMSATVSAPVALLADSLATALCVLSPEEGLKLIETLPRVEAVVIGLDGKVRYSSGLAGANPASKE
ncbi:MAG: thiamine biosynthesis lipoprotein [Planctomycetota bacterium]|jgi:thiamine biosynthesis lipoprotein